MAHALGCGEAALDWLQPLLPTRFMVALNQTAGSVVEKAEIGLGKLGSEAEILVADLVQGTAVIRRSHLRAEAL